MSTNPLASDSSRETLVLHVREAFKKRFDQAGPDFVVTAPGRVNIIGEHVDYNAGIVMPAAIERWTVAAIRKRDDGLVRIHDVQFNLEAEFNSKDEIKPDTLSWMNYIKGVVAGFLRRGHHSPGFDAVLYSSIPHGAGLSSSAALEAVFALAVDRLTGAALEPLELALLCQQAEHVFAGVPCGLMDQMAVISCKEGHLLEFDCRDHAVEHIPFSDPELAIMIIDSKVKHELAGGEYAKRRRSCDLASCILGFSSLRDVPIADLPRLLSHLDNTLTKRTRHVVTEIERTRQAALLLKAGDLPGLGQLLNQSHASLRDDYEVSCEEIDAIVAAAQALPGVYGCRMTGGGFGGSAIALVKKNDAQKVACHIQETMLKRHNFKPEIFTTVPTGGACIV